MQKLDHPPAIITFPSARLVHASDHADSGPDTSRRLLVVVSDSDIGAPFAAGRILEIANALKSPILFLGLCNEDAQEPSLRRQLVLLSAMIRDENVPFEIKIESGRDWLSHVKSNWREGDALVCVAGQRTGTNRMLLAPLLQANFAATIYVLNNPSRPDRAQSNWISTVFVWAGSIGIVMGFLRLQIGIDQASSNWVGTAMLMFSILVEICLIWIWNSLFE